MSTRANEQVKKAVSAELQGYCEVRTSLGLDPTIRSKVAGETLKVLQNDQDPFTQSKHIVITDNVAAAFNPNSDADLTVLISDSQVRPPRPNICVCRRESFMLYLSSCLTLLHTWEKAPSLKPSMV